MIIVFSVLMILVYFDVGFVNDDKIIPFQRSYLISIIEGQEIEGTTKPFNLYNYFFDINGTVHLQTTSRSAQNEIDTTVKIVPYNIEKSTPRPLQNYLPEQLHYVFPGAIDASVEIKSITLPKQTIIELQKYDSPLRYEGNKIIKYEDPYEYDFYLQERISMQNGTKEEITMKYAFNLYDEQKSFMAELENTVNEKIIISPFSQTIAAEDRKSNLIFGFFGAMIASIAILVALIINYERSN